MNARFVTVLTVFILTFILHLSVEQRDGLHSSYDLSMGAHAEAVLAPEAAPAVLIESQSKPLTPIQDIDVHEHDDHELIATEINELPAQAFVYEILHPEFHMQSVYYPLKRPPRS